ncbi:MAG: GNAT family N-acetyltransferase [Actinomycetia bacterium]|nr:GNAT family N-acetyltransferase [Actinomycetes bacterium]
MTSAQAPRLVEADARWPERFRSIASAVGEAIDVAGVQIHHVGSTSVPGTASKDRVDVLVEVPLGTEAADVVGPLTALGLEHLPEMGLYLPERLFFRRDGSDACNVHVEQAGRQGAIRDPRLVFRDALRADDSLRDDYVTLKRRAAVEQDNSLDYTDAKTGFVTGVLARAGEAGDHTGVHVRSEEPDSDAARKLVAEYVAFLEEHEPHELDVSTDAARHGSEYTPPAGTFLVAWDDATPVASGAVRELEPGVAELKRMWVTDSHRRRGLGGRMLAALETSARVMGCATARLDSMRTLESAVSMYSAHGYSEIEPYNSNADASIWMEKELS